LIGSGLGSVSILSFEDQEHPAMNKITIKQIINFTFFILHLSFFFYFTHFNGVSKENS